jgi:hypothetical protein
LIAIIVTGDGKGVEVTVARTRRANNDLAVSRYAALRLCLRASIVTMGNCCTGHPLWNREYHFFPDEEPVRLCHAHGQWLKELALRFEIVWASAWGAEANRLLTPLLQLPELPVIRFPPVPFEPREKVPPIAAFVGTRPTIWIDDALTPEARAWASKRPAPTLLIDIDAAEGLTRPVVDQSLRWADRHSRQTDQPTN